MANSKPEKIDIKIGHRTQALDNQTSSAEPKQPETDETKLDGGFSDSLRTHGKGTVISPTASADQHDGSSDSEASSEQAPGNSAQTKSSKQPQSSSDSVYDGPETPESESDALVAPEETYLAHGENTANSHDSSKHHQADADNASSEDDHEVPQESTRADTDTETAPNDQPAPDTATTATDAAVSAAEAEPEGGTFSQPAQAAEDPSMNQSSAPTQEDFYSSKLEFDSQGNIKKPAPRPQTSGKRQRTTSIRAWLLLAIFLVTAAAGYVMLYQLEQADPGSGIIFEWLE